MFRNLKANEIECRVGVKKDNGFSILLYKDARCDMAILDETVGQMNWTRRKRTTAFAVYLSMTIKKICGSIKRT